MTFLVRTSPLVEEFVDRLPEDAWTRLMVCWSELETDPDVDRVTKFYLRRPPWTGRIQHCGGFDTIYLVDETTNTVEIRAVGPAGFGRSYRP